MAKDAEFKMFNLKMPRNTWLFLKLRSIEHDTTMTDIVMGLLERYVKRMEKNEAE